jgi:hypothetical protein
MKTFLTACLIILFAAACVILNKNLFDNKSGLTSDGVFVVKSQRPLSESRTSSLHPQISAPELSEQHVQDLTPDVVPSPTPGNTSTSMEYKSVQTEKRDPSWAAPTERDITSALRGVPYINPSTLTVVCSFSVCEAHGETVPQTTPSNVSVAREYLARSSFVGALRSTNALAQEAKIREGPSGLAFTVKLDRLRR